MSSGAVKWFDLSEYDAKLERRETGGLGQYKLELEVDADRLEPLLPDDPNKSPGDVLIDMGWDMRAAGERRYLLTNHAPLNRKSEIVAALRPFFSEQEIESSHVSIYEMQQGEVVQGLQRRQVISQEELARDIDGVNEADFDRITASVKRAQKMRAERLDRQQQVVFDGKGRGLYNHLTDVVMERQGWDEPEAAFAVEIEMIEAARKPGSVHAVRLSDLAKAIQSGSTPEIEMGEQYALGRIATSEEGWVQARETILKSEYLRDRVETFKSNPTGPLVSVRDAMLEQGGGSLRAAMMDAVDVPVPMEEAFGVYSERLPFMVVRDSSVPTNLLAQNMVAVDKALDVISGELELPRDGLIPDQTTVPLRFSYDAVAGDARTMGNMSTIEGDEVSEEGRRALTLNLSVMKGRSFVHELGHVIDLGSGLTDDERHQILSRSGVLIDAQVAVDQQFPEGGEFADYLLDEKEVFARTFDAHFVNLARSSGDHSLSMLGGLQTTQGFDRAAPYGDLEKTSAFMNELKDVLALRREARHEASNNADARADRGANASVSFSI